MKPSPQISNAVLASGIVRPSSAETDSSDYFSSSVYEFQDGEDPSNLRSLGYQKPKHMWMAKEQALTGTLRQSSPSSASSTAIELNATTCVDRSNSSPALVITDVFTAPAVSRVCSPSPPVDLADSPSTTHSTQGLSVVLSSSLTNTSSSLCSHTPPISGNGLSTVGSASSCTSPNSIDAALVPTATSLKNSTVNNPSAAKPRRSSLRTSKTKAVTASSTSVVSRTPSNKTGRKRSVINGLAQTLTLLKPSSDDKGAVNTVDHSGSHRIVSRRRRTARSLRSNSNNDSQPIEPKKRITLTVTLSAIPHSHSSESATESLASDLHFPSKRSSTGSSKRSSSKTSGSAVPCQYPLVPGGLKIRLRRDYAPLEVNLKRNKRSKNKVDTSNAFRIVESWCDTDAPGGEFSRRTHAAAISTSSSPSFTPIDGSIRVGDIVWAKLAGYPHWPSRVSAIWARTAHQLSQATPLSIPGQDPSSLSVLATPSDPALAAGYTARVDWLAWDQWSYLSCAKLCPFKEAYDKMYNPRTRVKGYAEAIRLAKRFSSESQSVLESQLSDLSPTTKSTNSALLSHISAPPSTDSHWSACNTLPCSLEQSSSAVCNSLADTNEIAPFTVVASDPIESTILVREALDVSAAVPTPLTEPNQPSNGVNAILGSSNDLIDPCSICGPSSWAPLPQLDISGLGDFVSHVPTFSEDEDDIDESVTSQLRLDFDICP
ncbi:hypothetical protein EG68_09374 [Paragonimus skrjabini miyazakii]|uniref:PWWP domain-containing protein n=1 Tax=Paragonimus skrjabini miyazakii TaxID=59628 RepID=A0A8S9YQY6_9TREM|nr:hypothetical protein EG68_09374 [Paragonimus skrjabini miyazakii]